MWGRLLWQEKLLSLAGRSWEPGCTYSGSSLGGGRTAGSSHVVMWMFCGRVTLDLPWGSSTAMISARQPFPASRLSTWALRTCASSNLCWRSGWVMQVGDITCPQSWPGQEDPSRNLHYNPGKWELELRPRRSVAVLVCGSHSRLHSSLDIKPHLPFLSGNIGLYSPCSLVSGAALSALLHGQV